MEAYLGHMCAGSDDMRHLLAELATVKRQLEHIETLVLDATHKVGFIFVRSTFRGFKFVEVVSKGSFKTAFHKINVSR